MQSFGRNYGRERQRIRSFNPLGSSLETGESTVQERQRATKMPKRGLRSEE